MARLWYTLLIIMIDLLSISLFIFALIFLANYAVARSNLELNRVVHWIYRLINLPIFLAGLAFLFVTPQQAADSGLPFQNPRGVGILLLGMAIWALVVTLPEVRNWLARFMPLDPMSAMHTLALMLSGYLVANSFFILVEGGLTALAEQSTAVSIAFVVLQGLMFVLAAILGVGIFIRRDWRKTLDRLGLEWPAGWQLVRGMGWTVVLVILQGIGGLVWALLQPEEAETLNNVTTQLLGDFDTAGEWFLLALTAGVGEEILFRGALQPVLGIWVTSFLFALAHGNYGLTPATFFVFLIGVVLGLVRQRYSTTVAIFIHFAYNFVLGMLALYAPVLERSLEELEPALLRLFS